MKQSSPEPLASYADDGGRASVRYAVRLPDSMFSRLKDCIRKEGLSAKKRSAWISRAIINFAGLGVEEIMDRQLLLAGFPDAGAEPMPLKTVLLSNDAEIMLDDLIIALRISDPLQRYDKSIVVRAAIAYSLEICLDE